VVRVKVGDEDCVYILKLYKALHARSEATSGRSLVMWEGGMCEERSYEQKVLLLKRGGMFFSSSPCS